jgi:hypothetical protein
MIRAKSLRRGAVGLAITTVAVVGLALVSSAVASPPNNYWEVASWLHAPINNGVEGDVSMTSNQIVSNADYNRQFVEEGTDNNLAGTYYVRVGLAHGFANQNILTLYWADERPGPSYNEHQLSAGLWNTKYHLVVDWEGNNSWNIFVGNTHVGTSTSNPGPSVYMATGLDTSDPSNSGYYAVTNPMQWKNTSNVWSTSGWGAGTLYEDPSLPGGSVGWISPYISLADFLNYP